MPCMVCRLVGRLGSPTPSSGVHSSTCCPHVVPSPGSALSCDSPDFASFESSISMCRLQFVLVVPP
ncbi:hypothetical protein CPB84DRAFT_1784853 [Gymnopilus junonius]|uniref:Uncharacterized protein n=1 Tax=Gymnopilus junonius TaxID=109634 RepID=A0A9P5NLC6_GYMJU|nr:hypothetical protein CPB84DRAFT_1784853 [Gymnopilus junonius]